MEIREDEIGMDAEENLFDFSAFNTSEGYEYVSGKVKKIENYYHLVEKCSRGVFRPFEKSAVTSRIVRVSKTKNALKCPKVRVLDSKSQNSANRVGFNDQEDLLLSFEDVGSDVKISRGSRACNSYYPDSEEMNELFPQSKSETSFG